VCKREANKEKSEKENMSHNLIAFSLTDGESDGQSKTRYSTKSSTLCHN